MEECKYRVEIEGLKTDRTVLITKMEAVEEKLDELGKKIDKLSSDINDGVVEKKAEAAIERWFFRFLMAAITSAGGIGAFVSWLVSRSG